MGLPYKLKRIDDPDKGTRTYVEDGILAGLAGLIPVLVLGVLAWKGIHGHYFSEDGAAHRGPSEVSTILLAIAAVAMLIYCVWCFAWRRRLVFDLRNREL
ncbi:MAG: hypothetical protein QGD94_08440 [Planctomycetia bacterium]|nr:hypothetical protein [Planctomycetia bacterium]